jgi:integrase
MELRLEDDTVTRITVPKGKRDVLAWDTQTTGLFLRKFASGRAMWGVKYAVAGKPRVVVLRDAGERGSLAAARREALDVRAKARLGTDLIAEREAAKAAAAAAAARAVNTLSKVAVAYLSTKEKELRPRSCAEVTRCINRNAKPLHGRPIAEIERGDIVDLIDTIERNSGKREADKTRIELGALWAWALDRGHVAGTPFVGIKSRASGGSRDRVLTPAELRQVWQAAAKRGDELAWAEIVEAGNMLRIELPPERTKNHRGHHVHLASQAVALLPPRPDATDPDARTMLFGRRRHTGFSGWSKAKAEIDADIAEIRRKAGIRQAMKPWRLHDLRRTAVTLMGELGIAEPHVIEAIVNHVSGTKGGVAGVYNRAMYWDERVKALDAWGAWVEANVITKV